jgi:uncharacterized membrane protein
VSQVVIKGWLIVLLAALGGIAFTGTQIVERITILQDPTAVLACDVNATLSCSNVLEAWQSSVIFGVPNAFIGAVMFTIFASAAIAGLLKSRLSLTYLRLLWGLIVFFAMFATWFMLQTAFVINALCLWCIGITTAVGFIGAALTWLAGTEGALRKAGTTAARTGLWWVIWLGWWVLLAGLLWVGLAA